MLSSESQHWQGDTVESGGDTLDLLSEAITSYLGEIDEYSKVCVRHERTTAVWATRHAIRLTKWWSWSEAARNLCKAVEGLPGWDQSPLWDPRLTACIEQETTWSTTNERTEATFLVARGVTWEGRPMFVRASRDSREQLLEVNLVLPWIPCELPNGLPLRGVAVGLMCYDALVPESVANPLPVTMSHRPGACSIREYLTRTMPQNRYASKCFSLAGAEQ